MTQPEAVSESLDGNAAVVLPLEATHWGTRWMKVQDPDGRVFVLEEVSG